MKEILERLLTENNEMIMESPLIGDDNYRVGYVQALLNMKSSIEFELNKLSQIEINMDETMIKVVWLCFWWGLIGIIMMKK